MPAYELDKRIKSVFVSITLLQEIEKYLLEQAEMQRKDDSRIKYSVTIYDKFGEERIDSFENYHRSTLPNETKRITLDVHDYSHDFRIVISFSREAAYSNLKVQIVENSAKEKAKGIANTIESQLNEYKNLNFIFHSWISYVMPMVFGGAFGWTIPDLIKKNINIGTKVEMAKNDIKVHVENKELLSFINSISFVISKETIFAFMYNKSLRTYIVVSICSGILSLILYQLIKFKN